jgi:hypothetical protein
MLKIFVENNLYVSKNSNLGIVNFKKFGTNLLC